MDKLDFIILLNIIILIFIFLIYNKQNFNNSNKENYDDNKIISTYYDINKNIKI
jgi:hypothetical protein